MRRMVGIVAALAGGLGLQACGHTKELAPIRLDTFYPRIPNQQRLIAAPARRAAEKACAAANLTQYAGRSARVEVTGVFPHSDEELLDYISTVVEAEAATAGVEIRPRPDPAWAPSNVIIAHHGHGRPQLPAPAPPVDVRLVASVDWGGIDLNDQQYLKGWPLGGQIGLAVVSLLAGIGATAGTEARAPQLTVGIPLLGLAGAGLWAILDPSVGHVFTMKGRFRVTVTSIPQRPGLAAASGSGEDETSIVVDPESPTGYALTLELPREAGDTYQRQAR